MPLAIPMPFIALLIKTENIKVIQITLARLTKKIRKTEFVANKCHFETSQISLDN